jgi:hypothetical protein
MDEYTEPYADDPKVIDLRAKETIIYECQKASANPNDGDAINSVLEAHANAADRYSLAELTEFIHSWRTPRGDIIGRHAVECALFNLELSIQDRIGEICFEESYRPFMDASPVKLGGLTRLSFLTALFPQGMSVLMLDSSKAKQGLPWNTAVAEDIGGAWFWPLPVIVDGDEDEWIDKAKDAVAVWNSATANFSGADIELMRDQIISGEMPVRFAMSTNAGTTVVFAIIAASEAEWRNKCRELRSQIQAIGASCPPFRYDWVSPMIHSPFTRLVYFNP